MVSVVRLVRRMFGVAELMLVLSSGAVLLGAAEIEVFHAQEVKPQPPAGQPRAATNAPPPRTNAAPASGGIEVFQAESAKLRKPGGVDPVAKPSALDTNLVGRWRLTIPGVAYQTEQDRGTYTERRLHTGGGAAFGELRVRANGQYEWRKNRVTERGRLEQVVPRNSADPKLTYWRLRHGRDTYYIVAPMPGELAVYSAVESFVANGARLD